jgi:hypothetical protein
MANSSERSWLFARQRPADRLYQESASPGDGVVRVSNRYPGKTLGAALAGNGICKKRERRTFCPTFPRKGEKPDGEAGDQELCKGDAINRLRRSFEFFIINYNMLIK